MRQVLNWVGGGFFRTIGRTLAFLALGALAYYLFSKSSFDIKNLFFEKVNASTLSIPVKKYQSSYFGVSNSTGLTEVAYGYVFPLTRSTNDTINNRFFQFTSPINGSNFDYIQFDFLLSIPSTTELNNDSTITGRYCSKYECYQYCATGGCAGMCEEYRCTSYSSYSNTIASQDVYPIDLSDINFSVRMEYTDGNFAFCDIQNGKIICPTNHSTSIKGIDLYYSFRAEHITSASFILYRATEYYQIIDTAQAIENQTQQQQQQHNETMTYFQDTNSTETDETATSFFDSFEDSDHGGLSSIITAPLVVINEMLNGVCVQPSATWKGATISLPCGDMLWSRNGASDLKNLLNIFYGGVICYYAIRKLFMMIEGLKDPTQDRIEVTDL